MGIKGDFILQIQQTVNAGFYQLRMASFLRMDLGDLYTIGNVKMYPKKKHTHTPAVMCGLAEKKNA